MAIWKRLLHKASARLSGLLVVAKDGRVLLERFRLLETPRLGVYLHRLVGADLDPNVFHDHPWSWSASLILAGGYIEERPGFGEENRQRRFRPGYINRIDRDTFHRITWISEGGAWSLYCRGKQVKKDGFLIRSGEQGLAYRPAEEAALEQKVPFNRIDEVYSR